MKGKQAACLPVRWFVSGKNGIATCTDAPSLCSRRSLGIPGSRGRETDGLTTVWSSGCLAQWGCSKDSPGGDVLGPPEALPMVLPVGVGVVRRFVVSVVAANLTACVDGPRGIDCERGWDARLKGWV